MLARLHSEHNVLLYNYHHVIDLTHYVQTGMYRTVLWNTDLVSNVLAAFKYVPIQALSTASKARHTGSEDLSIVLFDICPSHHYQCATHLHK